MRVLTILLLLLLVATAAFADEVTQIAPKELEKLKIDTYSFSIVQLSEDGKRILAYDRPPVTLKKVGMKVRIWVLDIDSGGRIAGARDYGIDIPGLEQANFTPDGKSVVLVTRRGAEFYLLNLEDGKLTTLMTHVKGQPGFRADPSILVQADGKLLTVGYFYDGEDIAEEIGVAELDPTKTGIGAFTPGPKFEKLEREIPKLISSLTLSTRCFFFTGRENDQSVLYTWTPQNGLKAVDRGKQITGSWAEGSLMVYSMDRGANSELVLYDGARGSRQGSVNLEAPLLNLVLSRYGQTVAGCAMTGKNTVDIAIATQGDGYKPRIVARNLAPCVIRVAGGGEEVACYSSSKGLTLIKVSP